MVPLINCHDLFVDALNTSIYDKLVKSIVVRCHGVSTDIQSINRIIIDKAVAGFACKKMRQSSWEIFKRPFFLGD